MFKTIFARFGNIKAGKFVDDETGESLNDVAKVLSQFNIELYDTKGNMADVGEILDELHNRWGELEEVEKNALASAIAGTRQRENFIVLMDNYGNAIKYTEEAMNSSGTAMEKYDAYLQSIEASQAKLKATFEEFSQALIDSGIIKAFYDMASNGVELLTMLIKLTPVLEILGSLLAGRLSAKLFLSLDNSVKKLLSSLNNSNGVISKTISNIKLYRASLKSTGDKLQFVGKEAEIAAGKMAFLQATMTAVSLAVSLGIFAWQNYKKHLEETANKARDVREETESQKNTVQSLIKEYEELQNKANLDTTDHERIAAIEKELNEQIVLINKKLDSTSIKEAKRLETINLQNAEYIKQKGILNDLNNTMAKILLKDAKADLAAQENKIESLTGVNGRLALDYALNKFGVQDEIPRSILSEAFDTSYIPTFSNEADTMVKQLEALREAKEYYLETYDAEELANNDVYNSIVKTIDKYGDLIDNYQKAKESYWEAEINQQIYNDQKLTENAITSTEDMEAYITKLKDKAKTENDGKEISEAYAQAIEDAVHNAFPEFVEKTKESEESTYKYVESLESVKKELEATKDAYDAITGALDEYNDSGSISYDTYMSLLDLGDEYIGLLFDENGALIDNRTAVENLMRIKLQQYAIEKGLAYLQSVATNGMKLATDSIIDQTNATNVLSQAQLIQAQTALLQIEDIEERRKAAEKFVSIVNSMSNVSFGNTSATNSNSDAKEKAKKIQEQYNSTIEYAKTVLDEEIKKLEEEKEAIEERNEALQKDLDLYDKALAYINKYISGKIDALEKEKEALQEKNDEQEREIELEELRNNINANHQRTMRTYSEDQGWTWVVDPEDIKETEDAIKEYNKKVAEYEKEDEIAKIEEQIEAWEEYLAKWEEIPSVYEEMEDKLAFESLSAYVTEKDLLNKRTTAVDNFKKSYVKKQKEISRNTTEEIDKQIEKLQDIKEKWEAIPSDYETASDKLNAEMILGKDARDVIISGEIGAIQNFASQYAIAMKSAEVAAKTGAKNISAAVSGIEMPKVGMEEIYGVGLMEEETEHGYKGYNGYSIVTSPTGKQFVKLAEDRYVLKSDTTSILSQGGGFLVRKGAAISLTPYASGTLSAKAGLANVDEKGNELIVPKQGRYRMMEYGDTVVPHNLSQRLFDVASNPLKFIANAINSIKSPILNEFGGNNNITTISIENITMPQSVNNADRFVKELQLIAANR